MFAAHSKWFPETQNEFTNIFFKFVMLCYISLNRSTSRDSQLGQIYIYL